MFSLCTCDFVLVLFTVSLQNDTHLINTQWNSLECIHTNTFSFRFKRDLCPDEHFSANADHWCEEGAEGKDEDLTVDLRFKPLAIEQKNYRLWIQETEISFLSRRAGSRAAATLHQK